MNKDNAAIKVKKISKLYRIGMREKIHDNLGSALFDFVKSPLVNFKKYRALYTFNDIKNNDYISKKDFSDIVWALKDISFDVNKGERLGIIGKNGAGKSTLLKILSRITSPTSGSAKILGRVSSLLEVGTGFHQELTGRENVYLNAVILGMTKNEVDKRFDEIVDFSGVEKFIDTPVKRYSSGMKVRLAFSVAAHLEPEILIVDEVLAVGDVEFQKKCITKMEEVGQEGRTVLFVSHKMSAITRLCQRAILIDNGRIIDDGPPAKVVNAYINPETRLSGLSKWENPRTSPGDNNVRLSAVRLTTENGQTTDSFDIRKSVFVQMDYEILESGLIMVPYFYFYDQNGTILFGTLDRNKNCLAKGNYRSTVQIPGNFLSPGMTFVNAYMMSIEPTVQHFRVKNALSFEVIDSFEGDSARGYYGGRLSGAVRPLFHWNLRET